MTVIERRASTETWTEYALRRLRTREEIRPMLEARRPYAAYALGQLEPQLFGETKWWLAASGTSEALVLHSRGGLGHATFTMGEAGALEAALRLHPGPRSTFLTCEPHHLPVVLRTFELEQRQTMIRMQLSAQTFTPVGGPVRRLHGADARDLNRLYRAEGVPSYYSARQIEDAVYYGAEVDGQIVAVAGTHVVSAASGIAVVGNVFTHPRYRRRRLAQAVTSAVTEQLLRVCRDVVLSVDPANVPAVGAYARLGYAEVARLIEGPARRKDLFGLRVVARRALARARSQDGEERVRMRVG